MAKDLAARHREMLLDEFGSLRGQAKAALELMDEGATLPFIARYRKERTQGLTEIQLKEIMDRADLFARLEERKATILATLEKQGVLSGELSEKIIGCRDRNLLEDLYLPFRPRRRTRAQVAREAGYEPLADLLWAHRPASGDEKAMAGACDIVAERMAEHGPIREWIREKTLEHGRLQSRKKRGCKAEGPTKFDMYFEFGEPLLRLAPHRILAMYRGEREGVLSLEIDVKEEPILREMDRIFNRSGSPHRALYERISEDAYRRLLAPSIESEIRKILKERAEEEAFRIFAANLRNLLLAPPARGSAILGVDPGFRTGCKLAVVDATGRFLEKGVMFPDRGAAAGPTVRDLVERHGVELVALGNGTASRETESFLRGLELAAPVVVVSEAGASVYSASETAVREFPELDVTIRGAISIARRLQDPLAELVKIDPKAIGVGQYQHDVNQDRLKQELDLVVELCVNAVGVDVNTASVELLSYVSGINRRVAEKMVERRPFIDRKGFRKVPGLGEKAFELSAGFLRIPGGENPLDGSAVHPESYGVVENIARRTGRSLQDLIGVDLAVSPEDFVDGKTGLPTVIDILDELKKPGRDPRREFKAPRFDDQVSGLKDLKEGMKLEGVVTNVTGFGAFVDVGVHQDGLVHVSELADRFVKDPNDVVRVGQLVKVKVLQIDVERKRIALSMKQA